MTNAAERLADRLSPGTRFVYVSNTYHDSQGGNRWAGLEMVVKSGRWSKDLDVPGLSGGFRMEVPKAAKNVTWLDDDTVRYAIVGRPDHFVTLKLSAPDADTPVREGSN